MRDYARNQTATLLRRLAFQVSRSAKSGDPDAVHDLRVATRRFSQCLRVFAQFYPGNSGKKVRRQVRGLRNAAGAVRDLDIAMELLHKAGVGPRASIIERLQEERRSARRELLAEIRLWKNRGFSRKWRSRLDLAA